MYVYVCVSEIERKCQSYTTYIDVLDIYRNRRKIKHKQSIDRIHEDTIIQNGFISIVTAIETVTKTVTVTVTVIGELSNCYCDLVCRTTAGKNCCSDLSKGSPNSSCTHTRTLSHLLFKRFPSYMRHEHTHTYIHIPSRHRHT